MNTINKKRLAAVLSLSGLSLLTGLASAQTKPTIQDLWNRQTPPQTPQPTARPASQPLRNTRDFGTKASANKAAAERRKLGYQTTIVYDAKRKVYILREYGNPKPAVRRTVTPTPLPTAVPRPAGKLLSQRRFGTKASANKAVAMRRKLGYQTTVTYDAKNRVYIVREYSAFKPTAKPIANPVLSRREFGTRASASAAATERRKLGYFTTVVYDAKNRVYILREYASAPKPVATPVSNPVLNQRSFGTKVSANKAAAARHKLGYKTTVTYDERNRVYILREYKRN